MVEQANNSQTIAKGKLVQFSHRITDGLTGEVLEHSDLPLSYIQGEGKLLKTLEEILEGKAVGAQVEVNLPPEEGYGKHLPELTFTDDIDNVPVQFRQIGAEVEMKNDQGESRTFHVSRIEGGKLTVDGNHPLAGKTLLYRVNVLDIRDATAEELAHGVEPFSEDNLKATAGLN